uniref:LOW QUALITY PROTEIN: lateral signaling target protein 2 homolog n=1 Tax=Myxine glutinosa TaxID=7769 RepID=UPI00358F55FB
MYTLRKWLYKPKRGAPQLLAQCYHADEELQRVAAELDSFDGRREPRRCMLLVNQLRTCQDRVLVLIGQIMEACIPSERADRDFCAKFPDEVRHDGLAGQLWFGAECLAAGSIIMNREVESLAMRPLARQLTRALEDVRSLLRDQCLRDLNLYPQRLRTALCRFDELFAEFELSYVSAMVPVKSPREYDIQQDVVVLFCETIQRALRLGYLTQEMIDDYDPALMFTIPRLAIVCGLVVYPEGPLDPGRIPDDMSELFRPFHTLLRKVRDLLRTLTLEEQDTLERSLCASLDHPSLPGTSHPQSSSPSSPNNHVPLPTLPEITDSLVSSPEPSVPLPGYQADLACSLQFDAHEQAEISALVHRAGSVMHCLLSPPSSNPSPARHVVSPFEQLPPDEDERLFVMEDVDGGERLLGERPREFRDETGAHGRLTVMLEGGNLIDGCWKSGGIVTEDEERGKFEGRVYTNERAVLENNNVKEATNEDARNNFDNNYGLLVSRGTNGESNCRVLGSERKHRKNEHKKRKSILTAEENELELEKNELALQQNGVDLRKSEDELENNEVAFVEHEIRVEENDRIMWDGGNGVQEAARTTENVMSFSRRVGAAKEIANRTGGMCLSATVIFRPRDDAMQTNSGCSKSTPLNRSALNCNATSGAVRDSRLDCAEIIVEAAVSNETSVARGTTTPEALSSGCQSDGGDSIEEERDYEEELELQATKRRLRARFKGSGDLIIASSSASQPATPGGTRSSRNHLPVKLPKSRLKAQLVFYSSLLRWSPSSGVADQLQTNYASDLRTILKVVFEVVATKSEPVPDNLQEQDAGSSHHSGNIGAQQFEANEVLQDIYLEDCALCHDLISTTDAVSKKRPGEFEVPPEWVPDEECNECAACCSPFTVIRRKHHCRNCGKIFCSRCSPHSAPLPRYGQSRPVRVCTHCFLFHVTPFCSEQSTT